MIAHLQKEAYVQKLNFYFASGGHQITKKKKPGAQEKLQKFRHVYEENGFAFFSRYGELELNFCSFVFCTYFHLKLCLSVF